MSSKRQKNQIPLKNLEGILLFANTHFPVEKIKDQLEGRTNSDDLFSKTHDGFRMGQTITNLYMIEIMLKYLHQQRGEKNVRQYGHNIHKLFCNLRKEDRHAIKQKYEEVITKLFEEYSKEISLESLLDLLDADPTDPITKLRYFWEDKNIEGLKLIEYWDKMIILGYSILVSRCDYPESEIPSRKL